MMLEQLPIYEYLNLQPLVPPNSSYLYSLEPIGLGTPYVESLTSYIKRLADAHCVHPGILQARLSEKFYSITGKSHFIRAKGFHHQWVSFNGTGIVANDWVQIIEALTLQKNLLCLTFIKWKNVISSRLLLRRNRAWCPSCYAESYKNQLPVYDLLAWTLAVIEVCPKHHYPLATHCPHCGKEAQELEFKSKPGHCSKCGKWLGESSELQLERSELDWQISIWNTLGEVLSAIALPLPSKGTISRAISECINQVTDGNTAEFARVLHLPKNTVWMWQAGKVLPSLASLLRICYCLQIPLLTLLTEELHEKILSEVKFLPQEKAKRVVRSTSKKFDSNRAQSLLEEAFLSHCYPPLSMKATAQELGYNDRHLRKYFPELCKAISSRYLSYSKYQRLQKEEKLCREIRQIATSLHSDGIYPTNNNVAIRLPKPGLIRVPSASSELRRIRSELFEKA